MSGVRDDRLVPDPRFPSRGRAFGGNDIRPIRWSPWLASAPVAGVVAATAAWSGSGGSLFAAAATGVATGLAVPSVPLRLRNYWRPQPPPIHVGPHGLSVYLAERGPWRAGTYHQLPWPVVSELTSLPPPTPEGTELPLRIAVTAQGRAAASNVPGPVGESLRSTGTVVLADAVRPDLARAVAHYSGDRCQLRFENHHTPT